jgi:hypothetical protein
MREIRYKINKYNPLTYIIMLIYIPVAIIISIFIEGASLPLYFSQCYSYLCGEIFYNPYKVFTFIFIVVKVKETK